MKFLKLFTNFTNKKTEVPIIQKCENIFKSDSKISNDVQKYRTLVDMDNHPEDIFRQLERVNISIPNQSENDVNKITLFVPLDDFLCHTVLPDTNLGMINMPNSRNYDFKLDLPEYRSFAYVYLRNNLSEFLNYINENYEPILYSKGERTYVDKLLDKLDEKKVFRYRLYQTHCHLYRNPKQDIVEYFRDIHLFDNRSLKRKIIIDFQSLNNILQPDNTIPIEEYFPDDYEEDNDLIDIIYTLQSIVETNDDVRNYLIQEYNMRNMLINSKLL